MIVAEGFSFTAKADDYSACKKWDSGAFSLGGLCIVTEDRVDDRPLYRGTMGTKVFRLLFDEEGVALVVSASKAAFLSSDLAGREALLRDLTPGRLEFWHADALYWQRWLESLDWGKSVHPEHH